MPNSEENAGNSTPVNQALVSVVIVNWNRRADVRVALDYLGKVHYRPVEIIVVDNGSEDGSVEEFGKRAGILHLALGENAGPAKARNAGATAARGKYLFFLDSDAVLSKRALAPLVALLEEDSGIALAACRIDHAKTRRIDQWIYATPHDRYARQQFEAYSFSAAGALVRRAVFLAAGGFNEKLRIYNEETDLAYRFWRDGHRVVYDSAARVLHRPSDMGRVPGGDYWRLMIRNWIWIFLQYYPPLSAWRRIAAYSIIYLFKGWRAGHPAAVWRGIHEALRQRSEFRTSPGEKFSPAQIARLDAMNRRRRITFGRG